MIKERIELLQKEVEQVKKEAANLYFRISVKNELHLSEQYDALKVKALNLQQDLEHALHWLKTNGECN